MAFAFDQLCELTVEHHSFEDAVDSARDSHGTHTYSEGELQTMARWNTETDVLTFYLYYEPACGNQVWRGHCESLQLTCFRTR